MPGDEVERELIRIERTLWTNDAAIYEAAYLPDAVLIFPEVGKLGRDEAVAAIYQENAAGRHWAEVAFLSVRVLTVAPEVALLSYEARARWRIRRRFAGETRPARSTPTSRRSTSARWRTGQ